MTISIFLVIRTTQIAKIFTLLCQSCLIKYFEWLQIYYMQQRF